jgi:predicted dehydrogenase
VDSTFEDVAHLRLHYDEIGVTAHIHVSWLDPRKVRQLTAVGSKKMVVYDDTNVEERIRIHDKAVLPNTDGASPARVNYHRGPVTAPVVAFEEPLAVQARHFVECLSSGRAPYTGGANGLAVVEVIEAAQLSLAQERRVLLREVAEHPGPPARELAELPELTAPAPAGASRPRTPVTAVH